MLDKNTFESEVLEAEGYVLVDYFSDGCKPCKALMPAVEGLAVEFDGRVKFSKLNTTKARRLAISQRVMGLPAILLYKDGKKVDELTKDDATKENIRKMVEKVL